MELAVVVVLDDPASVLLGPLHQSHSLGKVEDAAHGVLVSGRAEQEPGPGRFKALQRFHIQDVVPEGDWNRGIAQPAQRVPGAPVSRIFTQDTVAPLQENVGNKRERLLRAIGDYDLVFFAANTAGGSQVGGDGVSQGLIPLDAVIAPERPAAFLMVHDPVPAADGKRIQVWQARLEWQIGVFNRLRCSRWKCRQRWKVHGNATGFLQARSCGVYR